uniref:Uncharacterized protein n=1 Tax=Sphaerodactylus townsendi TaxID=933632 RepID=A0ACB8EAK1_9SAUR
MIDIFVLKIENPDCFWVHVGDGNFLENETEYKKLYREINQFYNKSYKRVDEIKPSVLEEGQVCVVYCHELKSWCRAIVKSILSCTDYCLVECFLVDHAKTVPVKTDRICVALESFMRLPYRAKKFRLYCTKPVTLRVDYCNNNAEIVWDVAAVQYFQNLLNATAKVEAKLCAVEEESFDVYLYATIKGQKICVNDDLVAKNFAYYGMKDNEALRIVPKQKMQPTLSPESHSEKINPALVLWPTLLQTKESNHLKTYAAVSDNTKEIKHKSLQETASHNEVTESNVVVAVPPLEKGIADSVQANRKTNCPLQQKTTQKQKEIEKGLDKKTLCLKSCYVSLPSRNGPVALIICPGWKKAEQVFEFLEIYTHSSRPLHPRLLLLGLNKEEIKNVKLPRGCEVIVTTPYNALRLLECHSLMFLRLCHLVFDEAEVLFSDANEEMLSILEYYKNHSSIEDRESAPWQIVAVGSRWNKSLQYLTKEFMNDPYVVIASMEEAAVYGHVQQIVRMCLECDRVSTLLQVLDCTPTNTQKTLVFTSSQEETDMVSKAVANTSIFCLRVQPGIDFGYVAAQWNKKFTSATHAVLVLTDDCMSALGITDATCVIHFSFPTSPRIFGARLYGMSANFQKSVEKVLSRQQGEPKAKSILLLTEKSMCHAAGVLRYLERTEAKIPPELYDFISGVVEAKEESKSERPLCHHLKTIGVCKFKNNCPDRHRINLQKDSPQKVMEDTLPTAGNVTILPLFVVDATQYFGHIVGKPKDPYSTLAEDLKEYYQKASNHISVDTVEKLALYGLQENNSFHRVKPIDNETEWHPKVTRYIHQKIRGKPHEAKIVLTLGNTIWVDPMVRVTRLSDLKTSINEYNVRSEILSTGMGVDNPEHTQELQKLFRNAAVTPEKKDLPPLMHLLKCGTSELPVPAEQNVSDQVRPSLQSTQGDIKSNEPIAEDETATDDDETAQNKKAEESPQLPDKCFYPIIKWFDKGDVAVMKIKLRNVTEYTCKFSTQRIIFSAFAGDKFYYADMELQGNILKEKSTCFLKSDEPTIILAKAKEEPWCNLLKHKNPHVTFDLDYLEDCEQNIRFPVGPKKGYQHIKEEKQEEDQSSIDTDTESDDSSC